LDGEDEDEELFEGRPPAKKERKTKDIFVDDKFLHDGSMHASVK
jgi:hypothetical protein